MPIDEKRFYTEFGELKGTVSSLVVTVADMKGAIIPALTRQREEMALYAKEQREDMAEHKDKDSVVHAVVADVADWMRGDGTPENLGAKKQLNGLITGKIRDRAWTGGVAAAMSAVVIMVGWAIEWIKK